MAEFIRPVIVMIGLASSGIAIIVLLSSWRAWRVTRERHWRARIGLIVSYLLLAGLACTGVTRRALAGEPLNGRLIVIVAAFVSGGWSFLEVLKDQHAVFGAER